MHKIYRRSSGGCDLFLLPFAFLVPVKLPALFHIRFPALCFTQQQAICGRKRETDEGSWRRETSNSINYWNMKSTAQTLLDHKIFCFTFFSFLPPHMRFLKISALSSLTVGSGAKQTPPLSNHKLHLVCFYERFAASSSFTSYSQLVIIFCFGLSVMLLVLRFVSPCVKSSKQ